MATEEKAQEEQQPSIPTSAPVPESAKKVWGGVYVGPKQDTDQPPLSPPQQLPLSRLSSGGSKRSSSKRRKKEEQEAPVWGGVYIGPEAAAAMRAAEEAAAAQQAAAHPGIGQRLTALTGSFRRKPEKSAAPPLSVPPQMALSEIQGVAPPEPIPIGVPPATTPPEPQVSNGPERWSMKQGKARCEACRKKCTGDILKADEKFFHTACFVCKDCRKPLNEVGFFEHSGSYYCPEHYHERFGTRCGVCGKFVEGEVVTVMEKAYHQNCFRCDRCRQPFPSGQKVTFTGREHLCQKCLHIPVAKVKPLTENMPRPTSPHSQDGLQSPTCCAACGELIQSGQVLLALDAQWHICCFKCTTCDTVLHGEYLAKDGKPYCIRDYNAQFGVRCDECNRFIAGRVLQAGDFHFHPSCARCNRCGENFGDGEEMFMQGDAIWHPRCNTTDATDTAMHMGKGGSLRAGGAGGPLQSGSDFGRHLTYMYLLPEPDMGYLKQPIPVHEPQTPQFHTPQGKPVKIRKTRVSYLKTGMQKLRDQMSEVTPRPKSPNMDNEEPIELSHYPGGYAPEPSKPTPIEREDFPAPPYPYAVDDMRRRLSTSDVEEPDELDPEETKRGERLTRQEAVLKQYEKDSSIAHVFAEVIEDAVQKAKLPKEKDPRSASRTPNAKKTPVHKCRYESPINASPSRYVNRPRPWQHWDKDRAATTTIPYYQSMKPGYGTWSSAAHGGRAATMPERYYDMTYDPMMSVDDPDSTLRSDAAWSMTSSMVRGYERLPPATYPRTSLPDMSKPPKIYPYNVIVTTTKKLPEDVDRCHLERHLNKEEFHHLFSMTPLEFYRLPDWKRINMKSLFQRHLNKEEFHHLFSMTPLEFYRLPDWKRINMKSLFQRQLNKEEFHHLFSMTPLEFYRLPDWKRINMKSLFQRHLNKEEFHHLFSMTPLEFYRLPDWKRINMKSLFQRHLNKEEFHHLFSMTPLEFYRLPDWKRINMKSLFQRHLNKEEFHHLFSMTPLEFYRLPDWKRINMKSLFQRHLNKEEFHHLFSMTPLEFYRLPDWKRINMKRRVKLF